MNDIFALESPLVSLYKSVWNRIDLAYRGGRSYLSVCLTQHPSEADDEYLERKDGAYYLNVPKKVANKIVALTMTRPPRRVGGDPVVLEDLDRLGRRVDEVMRHCLLYHTLYGHGWLYVDTGVAGSGPVEVSMAARARGARPYACALKPSQVPAWYVNRSTGELEWAVLSYEEIRQPDPLQDAEVVSVRVLWTRGEWRRYEQRTAPALSGMGELVDMGVNSIGVVPLVMVSGPFDGLLDSRPPMEDVVMVSDSINRAESELYMNIVKQAYGLLVIPASFVTRQESMLRKLVAEGYAETSPEYIAAKQRYAAEISRSKCLIEDTEESGICRYISPDGITTDSIESHNDRLLSLLYDAVGFMVRTPSTQRESAESKSYDFTDSAAFLRALSEMVEQAERRMWEIMRKFDSNLSVPAVEYNKDFGVREFKSLIAAVVELAGLDVGKEYNRGVRRVAAELLNRVCALPDGQLDKILKEVEEMPDPGMVGAGQHNSEPNKPEDMKVNPDTAAVGLHNVGKNEEI